MGLLDKAKELEQGKGVVWTPEPGEAIAGEVIRYEKVTTKIGEGQLLQIKSETNDEIIDIWCATVLRRNLDAKNVQPGDSVGIKFHGIPEGKKYKDFSVIVEKVPATF